MFNAAFIANPYLMVASAGLTVFSQYQAGAAEKQRQNAIAAQQEQNAKFAKLEAEQQHNARQARLATLIGVNDTVMAVNRRGSGDRSARRLEKTERKKSATDDGRARTQSMLTMSRQRFAAADARASGNQAMRSALFKSLGTGIQAADMYGEIG